MSRIGAIGATTPGPSHCAWPRCDRARRYNTAASAVVITALVVLGTLIGVGVAVAIAGAARSAHSLETAFPPGVYGGAAGLVAASLGVLWGWFCGAPAILRLNGARGIRREDDVTLFEAVESISRGAGVPAPRVFLIDDTALNCCATGRGPRQACIAMTTGLRAALTTSELKAVIAHEIAHIRRLDTRFALVMSSMVGLIALACDWLWRLAFQAGRGAKRSTDTIKAWGWVSIAFFIAAGVLSVGAMVIGFGVQFCIRRDREYRADAFAAELTGDPASLASALKKLAADADPLVDVANRATAHLFIVNPLRRMRESGQTIDSPFCSHPPIARRIERLEELHRGIVGQSPVPAPVS